MTAANLHHSGVKAGDSMALGLSGLDESVGHGKAVAVLPGASGDYYDFLTHNEHSSKNRLTE